MLSVLLFQKNLCLMCCFNSGLWVIHCQRTNQTCSPLTCTSWNQSSPNIHSEKWLIGWLCLSSMLIVHCSAFCDPVVLDRFVFVFWIFFFPPPDDSELAPAFSRLHPLLWCYGLIFLWLEEHNQCPGWYRGFFDRMSCDCFSVAKLLISSRCAVFCFVLFFSG